MVGTDRSALVLFSGGQDSTTCLAWALSRYEHVETIGFDYGQRHKIELAARLNVTAAIWDEFPEWRSRLGADRLITTDLLSSLTRSALLGQHAARNDGLPATFVPGRNLVFLTLAAIVAEQRGIKSIVTGTCETDFSGYPDCRDDTIKATQVALNLGMNSRVNIETPLMWIDKAATWTLANDLGGARLIRIIVDETHTCYNGERNHKHDWGYGCAVCDACVLRMRGWKAYSI